MVWSLVLFLQEITCSNWKGGKVPVLIFKLSIYLALKEKWHLLSTLKVLFEMHN